MRANISASSTVMAAQGIFLSLTSVLYSMQPVCTEYMLYDATERTSMATAPYLAAREAPSTLYSTDLWQSTQGLLKQTILSQIQPLRYYNSSKLENTITSAVIYVLEETEPPSAVTSSLCMRGYSMVRDYLPRTHFVKSETSYSLTWSKPQSSAYFLRWSMAISRTCEPHILGPKVSVITASRSQDLCMKSGVFILAARSCTKATYLGSGSPCRPMATAISSTNRASLIMTKYNIYLVSGPPSYNIQEKMSTSLYMENPQPFLLDLHGKTIGVQLKWGWELRGILQSKDEYMNLLLANAEEIVNGEKKGVLGEILIRCNNILYIREITQ